MLFTTSVRTRGVLDGLEQRKNVVGVQTDIRIVHTELIRHGGKAAVVIGGKCRGTHGFRSIQFVGYGAQIRQVQNEYVHGSELGQTRQGLFNVGNDRFGVFTFVEMIVGAAPDCEEMIRGERRSDGDGIGGDLLDDSRAAADRWNWPRRTPCRKALYPDAAGS